MRSTFKKAAGVGVIAASIVTIGTVASAAAPEPIINACVGKVTGLVRILDPTRSQSCIGLEKPISWNQRGLPGPTGATGPAGPTGATGPAGPAGGGDVLWAKVQTRDGDNNPYVVSFAGQKHATEVYLNNDFHYRVSFDRPVDQCAAQVTSQGRHESTQVSYFGLPTNQLDVSLYIPDWEPAVAGDFVITVNC